MDDISKLIDLLIKNASKISELSSNALLTLFCFSLVGYIYWTLKQSKAAMEKGQEIGIAKAQAELLMARAMEKMSDAQERIEIIIDERLPKR